MIQIVPQAVAQTTGESSEPCQRTEGVNLAGVPC